MPIKFEDALKNLIARRVQELSGYESGEQEADSRAEWLKAEREIMDELNARADVLYRERDILNV